MQEEEGTVQLELFVQPDTPQARGRYVIREGGQEKEYESVLELAAYLEQLARPKDRRGGLK